MAGVYVLKGYVLKGVRVQGVHVLSPYWIYLKHRFSYWCALGGQVPCEAEVSHFLMDLGEAFHTYLLIGS